MRPSRGSRGRLEALIPYWQQRVTKSWGAWLCTQTKQTLAQASCGVARVKEIREYVREVIEKLSYVKYR